jgi:hypothetical protein
MNMRTLILRALGALALASPVAHAAPDIALADGTARSFNLGGGAFTDSFYFDAPANAAQLSFELSGSTDVDLLVRYGSPFPGTGPGSSVTGEYLFEGAHYRAISAETSERIAIGRYNVQPVRAGRWYVIALNFASTPSNSSIRVTSSTQEPGNLPITVVFDDATPDGSTECSIAEWNDSTPRAAAGGNSGTTVGQQRRNAVLEAARLLSTELRSPVPIRVKACWANACDDPAVPGVDSNRCTATGATLAFAGPRDIFRRTQQQVRAGSGSAVQPIENSNFLPRAQTWYSGTPATKLAGTPTCAIVGGDCDGDYEIRITFNNQIGQAGILGGRNWWYGFAPQAAPAPEIEFISTAMHEITHGLGFTGFVNAGSRTTEPVGAKLLGYDDIYSANAVRVGTDAAGNLAVTPILQLDNAARAAALTSFTNLRWADAEATASVDNVNRDFPAPDNLVRLFAPDPVQPGSSFSHVTGTGIPAGLMLPAITGAPRRLGIAAPMLSAIGWTNAPAIAPTDNLPRPTSYFDRTRPNHGVAIGRVFGNIHYATFYTYDAVGNPEWYLASGPFVDGVFLATPDPASGASLLRLRFRAGQNPEVIAASSGQIRIDFNQANLAPACNDGVARPNDSPLAVMTWSLGADVNRNWCLEAALPADPQFRAQPDFTGAWGTAESGWGLDMVSFRANSTNNLTGVVFFPDANNEGRWAQFTTASPTTPGTLQVQQRQGYCRTCPTPAGNPVDTPIGTMQLTLVSASQDRNAGNRVSFDVTYGSAPGGRFQRNLPMSLVSEPRTP